MHITFSKHVLEHQILKSHLGLSHTLLLMYFSYLSLFLNLGIKELNYIKFNYS